MILSIILGIILLIVSFSLKASQNQFSKLAPLFKILGALVILLGLFSSMFKQIDAGKVGVQSLYGSVRPDILPSGLHLINPLLDVTVFDTQTQNYTMSAIHDEGAQGGDDGLLATTRSQPCNPALGPWRAVHQRRLPAVSEGPPHHQQHECGRPLWGQRRDGGLLRRAQARTCVPPSLSDIVRCQK
jgi:hypothetical protein